jgi:hypothetical protein
MKRLKRFSECIAERESLELQDDIDSFKDFAIADGWLKKEDTTPVNTSPKLASELIRRKRTKKKRKVIELPVDLSKSGEYPNPHENYESRLHDLITIMSYLNELHRPLVEEQCRRIMKAIRSSNKSIDWLAKISEAERFGK